MVRSIKEHNLCAKLRKYVLSTKICICLKCSRLKIILNKNQKINILKKRIKEIFHL